MILPADPRFQPISEGLSTGLSGLLEGLAEGKAKEMHTKNLFNSLKGLNVDPRKAMAVALLPPESQGAAIQQLLQQPIKNQEIVRPQVLEAQHNFQIANQMKPLVDDLRALIKDPDLRSPQAQALIDKLGLHGAAINTPQQLFEKANKRLALYGGQLQGVKGNTTAALLETIGDTFPSLYGTPEGNEKLIGDLDRVVDELQVPFEQIRNIYGEQGNQYPIDVIEQATERSGPEIQKRVESRKQKQSFAVGKKLKGLPKVSDVPEAQRNDPTFGVEGPDGKIYVIRDGRWTEHKKGK